MGWFTYSAERPDGDVVTGQIEANSRPDALTMLRQQDLRPFRLTSEEPAQSVPTRKRLSLAQRAAFCDRLGTLLEAGVPLDASLELMGSGRDATANLSGHCLEEIRIGKEFAEALRNAPVSLDAASIALISIAERMGTLGKQLHRIGKALGREKEVRGKFIGQLLYPAFLVILLILTVFGMAYFVLPEFEGIFATSRADPPFETKLVIAAGVWIRQSGWMIGLFLLALFAATAYVKDRNPELTQRMLLRLPMVGSMMKERVAAGFYRALGELTEGGSPLSEALPLALKAIRTIPLRRAYENAVIAVRRGEPLSVSLAKASVIDRQSAQLIQIGEQTGRLGPMLLEAATALDVRSEQRLTQYAALFGPAITALIGLVTAAVIAAVMVGVMSLNEAIT